MRKGMLVSVYRSGPDTTNHGVTSPSRCPESLAILVGKGLPELFEPRPGVPLLEVVDNYGGTLRADVRIPGQPTARGMMGGNFVFTSDSRFRAVSEYPIPVHDRFEV